MKFSIKGLGPAGQVQTLLLEAALCVCLLLGYRTTIAALVGAGTSVSIALSVLYYDKQYEWPWSYYLMIGIHLLLLASLAGQHYGLDGLKGRGPGSWRRGSVWRWARRGAGVGLAVVVLYGLVTFGQVWVASTQGDVPNAQAIVVLGAAQYNGRPSPVLEARLEHALDLERNTGSAPEARRSTWSMKSSAVASRSSKKRSIS